MRNVLRSARRLSRDARGVTVVEFALVFPVFVTLLMFVFDAGYYLYASSILGGEVNAQGRLATLETANDAGRTAMDARITEQMRRVVPHGVPTYHRSSYRSYTRAQETQRTGQVGESFTDSNDNGICDNGETFIDENGNKKHDTSDHGGGGARDVVLYTATLTYDRLFPLAGLLGWDNEVTISASTVLRNQPFGKQPEVTVEHC